MILGTLFDIAVDLSSFLIFFPSFCYIDFFIYFAQLIYYFVWVLHLPTIFQDVLFCLRDICSFYNRMCSSVKFFVFFNKSFIYKMLLLSFKKSAKLKVILNCYMSMSILMYLPCNDIRYRSCEPPSILLPPLVNTTPSYIEIIMAQRRGL